MKYECGYGLCKNDFTIEQVELASFVNQNDAAEFIKMKFYNELYTGNKVFYVDGDLGREFYDSKLNSFTSNLENIYVDGYRITGIFEKVFDFHQDEDYDEPYRWTESRICLSEETANKIQDNFLQKGSGILDVEIKEDRINVKKHFREIEKFVKQETIQVFDELER